MIQAKRNTIQDVRQIELPKVHNRAGSITALNKLKDIPMNIERVFYLYDIPGGESRGAHAHKECSQLLIAAGGSFEIEVNDGRQTSIFFLNQPYQAVLIPPGIWASEINFSSGATCLVVASHRYDELDYIREYQKFLDFKEV